MAMPHQPGTRAVDSTSDKQRELGQLQQELAVGLERFIAASRAMQRKIAAAHGDLEKQLGIWQGLLSAAHSENEALDRYVEARTRLFRVLLPARRTKIDLNEG
jgi:hypothetical protein